MPIDVLRISEATQAGVSPICASCVHYWEGYDLAKRKGQPAMHPAQCASQLPCHGPFSGGSFPQYRGHLPEIAFATFCFICGEASAAVVRDGRRDIGVCEDHLKVLHSARAKGTLGVPTVAMIVVDATGKAALATDYAPTLKPRGLAEGMRQAGDWLLYKRRVMGLPT